MPLIKTDFKRKSGLRLPENERWHPHLGTQVGDLVEQLVPDFLS